MLGSVLRTNWNNFSNTENFNIAPESNPLPVELLSFTGSCKNNIVNLNWTTASEINNHYFELQQSEDGSNFVSIGRVEGNGTTIKQKFYSFTIDQKTERIFFRLVQYDFDGRANVLPAILVSCNTENPTTVNINLMPNPAKDVFVSDIYLPEKTELSMKVFNTIGQLVLEEQWTLDAGYHKQATQVSTLAKDIYNIRYTSNTFNIVKQIAIVK